MEDLIWRRKKGTNEVIDYAFDWAPYLRYDANGVLLPTADTIATSVFTVLSGTVTIGAQSHDDRYSAVWLSGGVVGLVRVKNVITTAGGRTMDDVAVLEVVVK